MNLRQRNKKLAAIKTSLSNLSTATKTATIATGRTTSAYANLQSRMSIVDHATNLKPSVVPDRRVNEAFALFPQPSPLTHDTKMGRIPYRNQPKGFLKHCQEMAWKRLMYMTAGNDHQVPNFMRQKHRLAGTPYDDVPVSVHMAASIRKQILRGRKPTWNALPIIAAKSKHSTLRLKVLENTPGVAFDSHWIVCDNLDIIHVNSV